MLKPLADRVVLKMTKASSSIYVANIKNISQKISDLISLGYTRLSVLKITKASPAIFSLSIENIKKKIEDLILLGYTKEDVFKMTKLFPTIYSYSIENIRQKITDLISLGYTKENVIEMTKVLPAIYGYSIENIKKKIEFYDTIGLHDLPIINPGNLMQSVSLSYARYRFYLDRGINIDISNFRKLFLNQKQFEKQYKITKEELIEKYSYDKYLEEMKNAKTK